jgi:hypothetical protein
MGLWKVFLDDMRDLFPRKVVILKDKKSGRFYSEIVNKSDRYCPKHSVVYEDVKEGKSVIVRGDDVSLEADAIRGFLQGNKKKRLEYGKDRV